MVPGLSCLKALFRPRKNCRFCDADLIVISRRNRVVLTSSFRLHAMKVGWLKSPPPPTVVDIGGTGQGSVCAAQQYVAVHDVPRDFTPVDNMLGLRKKVFSQGVR